MNITIIGGGIVGMATALELNRLHPGHKICLLEKESEVGRHQSTHNSGVLHAGTYYRPGSLKARLSVQGIQRMTRFCETHGIAHEICGKLILATRPEQLPILDRLFANSQANGLKGVSKIAKERIPEFEPHVAGIAALHVPEEGIVDYHAVCRKMADLLGQQGIALHTSTKVERLKSKDKGWLISSNQDSFQADFIINCGGLHCDRLASMSGATSSSRIIPFRGEYYKLKSSSLHLVRNLIYPVPDPTFPFLGVHFTRLIHGGIEAGPNAVLALAREGYRRGDFNLRDSLSSLGFSGLWRFLAKHPKTSWMELRRSFSKELFCRSLQELVPEIQESDLEEGGSGVRAQAMTPSGELVNDFQFVEQKNALHILNAPSPAATASLAIGEYVTQTFARMVA